jgi:hypothetical protein
MRKWLALIVLGLMGLCLLACAAAQLVPVPRTNPPVRSEPAWDSAETRALAERSCFDCHSNETAWPWYSRVAPVAWLVARDVQQGREELNFSDWGGVSQDDDEDLAEEVREVLEEGEMPLPNYLLLHPEARLTDLERQQLIDGLEQTLR